MTPSHFLSRVDQTSSPNGCWLWTGAKNKGGYGLIRTQTGTVYAHRVAWELFVGPIPSGHVVRHLCHVPNCVRPHGQHLRTGTQRENMLDSVRDQRLTVQRLTWEQVREIRLLSAEGTYTQADLAYPFTGLMG